MPDKDKCPSFQFYPGLWLGDHKLIGASLELRGFWIDILCAMWQSPEPGYLIPPTGVELVRYVSSIARLRPQKSRRLLIELEVLGITRRDDRGYLYSKRLVAEAARLRARRRKLSEAGKLGNAVRWHEASPADTNTGGPDDRQGIARGSHRARAPLALALALAVRTEEQQRRTYRVELSDTELVKWLPQQAAAFLESKGTEKATAFCQAIRDGVDRYGADAVKLGLRTFADRCYPQADIRNAVAFVQPILKDAHKAWVEDKRAGPWGDPPEKRPWTK